jgi:biopolymer transport protein TolR
VARNGSISVGHSRVDAPEKVVAVLKQILRERKAREVFLQADREVPYGRVVQVMAAIREAGIQKLGMVARQPKS